MSRKLALYFDGTWNTPGDRTNVRRLYDLTSSHAAHIQQASRKRPLVETPNKTADQIKYYHPGVGTTWGSRILGGMFGHGISQHIRDGLLWLACNYSPGDQIFILGFSRGAYTARSLVGLIRKCGIPVGHDYESAVTQGLVDTAYKIYRDRQWGVDELPGNSFKATYSYPDTPVHFLGVWDTVGALGLPIHEVWFGSDYYRFHDTGLSKIVSNAFHAVAIDEHRPDFLATMWDGNKPVAPHQKVEQRWFPGAHADVGGGYKDGKLWQITAHWMQQKAISCGLTFTEVVTVDPDAHLSRMHDSLHDFAWGLYAKLPWIYGHYRPRRMGVNEEVDDSAIRRRAEKGSDASGQCYNPPSLRDLLATLPQPTARSVTPTQSPHTAT